MEIDVSVSPDTRHEDQRSRGRNQRQTTTASTQSPRSTIAASRLLSTPYACCSPTVGSWRSSVRLADNFPRRKLNALVYVATFAVVYLQYFALFTIFGGTTPGMMFRGLQVASFSGAPPTQRQYLLRSLGYVLSATAVFAGFAWSWWDEDHLTWHDRISRTYLSSPATRAAFHAPSVATGR